MNPLEIIVAAIILVFALKGMKQGLILTVCSFLILFVAIALTQLVTPQVTQWAGGNEKIVDFMSEQVENVLFSKKDTETIEEKNSATKIKALSIPKDLKEQLQKNISEGKYKETEAANIQEYVSMYIAYSLINSIAYIIVFIVVYTLLKIIVHALDIISKFPVINSLNKIGGLGVGILEGLIIIWIGFVLTDMFCSTKLGITINNQIIQSEWLTILYDKNPIMHAITNVTKAIF